MSPATPKTEPPPSTQLRKAVFEGFLWTLIALATAVAPVTADAQEYTNFTVQLGPADIVPDASPSGIPVYPWFPDGHISYLPNTDGTTFQMYWAGSTSYRSIGTSISAQSLDPASGLLTAGTSTSDFDNGGAWLYSVHRKSSNDLVGFYHAEDQDWPGFSNPDNIAWKSMAYCYSTNNGVNWVKGGQILTSETPKPSTPTWGGAGDGCVVYDKTNARWVAFYSSHWIYTAVSTNAVPNPGTWRKYYNGSFSTPGLGGSATPVPGLSVAPGGNASVHFNTYLRRWIIIWHTWDGSGLKLSTSADLLNWTTPVSLITVPSTQQAWYGTIIGRTDLLASRDALLCYAFWPDKTDWQRQFLMRSIRFELRDADTNGLPDAWETFHFGHNGIDREADADFDGKSNEEEYLAGTNPTNAASVLRIISTSQTTNGLISLGWESADYKFYSIQVSTNLPGSWLTIATNIEATSPINEYSDAARNGKAFYRVGVSPY